jgi:signal transduction histidine kinase
MAQTHNTRRQELVSHFREKREPLRRQWVQQMRAKGLLQHLTPQDIEDESCALYDTYVDCLESGKTETLLAYVRSMTKSGVRVRMTMEHVIDGLLNLGDVYRRSLLQRYRADTGKLKKALDLYSPMANRLLALVTLAVVEEREQLMKREISQLRTLVRAGMILSSQLSLKAVLQRIVNMACKLVNARFGALGVLDGKGGLGQFITAGIDEKTKRAIGPLPVGKGILGVLVHEAMPLRLKDLTKDPQAHGFPANHPPMRSFLGVPIISKGKAFGNLYLTEKDGAEEFSEADQTLAMTLATQAAIAIENANLYEALQRSYQELKRSQDLLLRQEKLASLGRLAAGVAHELNNPLHIIAGFIEALQQRSQVEELLACKAFEEFPTFLTMAQREVDRAASIVRRLLDFARQREPAFESVDLGRLIAETIAFVDRQAAVTNRRIVVEPLLRPVQVEADAQMLQQLLLNLVTNALDAVEGGGEVRIGVKVQGRGQEREGQAEIVEIAVADNGCGIPPENLPKMFDPFFTTKEVGKGTGLGLPICQSIVEQHGGTIEVKSEGIGKGTTIIVRVPIGR